MYLLNLRQFIATHFGPFLAFCLSLYRSVNRCLRVFMYGPQLENSAYSSSEYLQINFHVHGGFCNGCCWAIRNFGFENFKKTIIPNFIYSSTLLFSSTLLPPTSSIRFLTLWLQTVLTKASAGSTIYLIATHAQRKSAMRCFLTY